MTNTENRRPLKTRSKPWAQALAKVLAARKIRPNQISMAGLGFAVTIALWIIAAGAAVTAALRIARIAKATLASP